MNIENSVINGLMPITIIFSILLIFLYTIMYLIHKDEKGGNYGK